MNHHGHLVILTHVVDMEGAALHKAPVRLVDCKRTYHKICFLQECEAAVGYLSHTEDFINFIQYYSITSLEGYCSSPGVLFAIMITLNAEIDFTHTYVEQC